MAATLHLRERAVGALLGAFVGDALGMPYEGQPGPRVPHQVEMIEGRGAAGSYTDDTQTMIAVAESLLRCDGISAEDLAITLRSRYQPERGYGSGTTTVMSLWDEGVPVSEAATRIFGGEGAASNGAAMRVTPVGVRFYGDEHRLVTEAQQSAVVTHAHPEGVDGAVVQAVAVAAAMSGHDPVARAITASSTTAMRLRLEQVMASTARGLDPSELSGPERAVAHSATASVPVAVMLGGQAETFGQAVTLAVRCGGDTDTVAAMAGAIAGARFGAHSIPPRWCTALEEGEHGRSHVERLAIRLADQAVAASAEDLHR